MSVTLLPGGGILEQEHSRGDSALYRQDDSAASLTAEVGSILHSVGLHDALAHLNARTRFRFTGVYHVDPPLLRNIDLFDRENPTLNVSGAVSSIDIGYCGIACETGAPFSTSNAQRDSRLLAHPARDSMLCYAGVPLRMPSGRAWGTLCHFDLRPRIVEPNELSILLTVMPLLADWVRDHCGAC